MTLHRLNRKARQNCFYAPKRTNEIAAHDSHASTRAHSSPGRVGASCFEEEEHENDGQGERNMAAMGIPE